MNITGLYVGDAIGYEGEVLGEVSGVVRSNDTVSLSIASTLYYAPETIEGSFVEGEAAVTFTGVAQFEGELGTKTVVGRVVDTRPGAKLELTYTDGSGILTLDMEDYRWQGRATILLSDEPGSGSSSGMTNAVVSAGRSLAFTLPNGFKMSGSFTQQGEFSGTYDFGEFSGPVTGTPYGPFDQDHIVFDIEGTNGDLYLTINR